MHPRLSPPVVGAPCRAWQEGTIKERLDASLASDRVQSEQAVSTLRSQLDIAKGVLKEAEAKATEFAKEYGKEFYLRKQIAEQLQEMTGGGARSRRRAAHTHRARGSSRYHAVRARRTTRRGRVRLSADPTKHPRSNKAPQPCPGAECFAGRPPCTRSLS